MRYANSRRRQEWMFLWTWGNENDRGKARRACRVRVHSVQMQDSRIQERDAILGTHVLPMLVCRAGSDTGMSELNESHATPLVCSACGRTVLITINRNATGNLTIICPNCRHEHYRYCEDGIITEDRWRSSAPVVSQNYYRYAFTATTAYTSTASDYARNSWYSTTAGGTGGW